jgi:hypothetical protein
VVFAEARDLDEVPDCLEFYPGSFFQLFGSAPFERRQRQSEDFADRLDLETREHEQKVAELVGE